MIWLARDRVCANHHTELELYLPLWTAEKHGATSRTSHPTRLDCLAEPTPQRGPSCSREGRELISPTIIAVASCFDHNKWLPWGRPLQDTRWGPLRTVRDGRVARGDYSPPLQRRRVLQDQRARRLKTLLALASDAWCQGGVNPLRAPKALDTEVSYEGDATLTPLLPFTRSRARPCNKKNKRLQIEYEHE